MRKDLKIEGYQKIFSSINTISSNLIKVIRNKYYKDNKYLYNAYLEAFSSIKAFHLTLSSDLLVTQAASLLRMATEFASIAEIISKYPKLEKYYIEHYRFRIGLIGLEKKEQNKNIKSFKKNFKNRNQALKFLDFGWINGDNLDEDYGYHELIKKAGFEDVYEWLDILSACTHGTITYGNIFGGNNNDTIDILHQYINIVCVIMDHLCISFKKISNFDFVINGKDEYSIFKNLLEENEISLQN